MAFVFSLPSPVKATVVPLCMGRNNSSRSRRAANTRSRRHPIRPPVQKDPILDDYDIDTTDISTYFSCPMCFNSIMLRPEQLLAGPMMVNCNCCGQESEAMMSKIENVDGSDFDYLAWKKEYCTPKMLDEFGGKQD